MMATERQEKSPAPDRVKMLDRFEKLDDALAAECVLVLVNLKVAATDQAIDQRQTTDHDGLPGFNGGFPLRLEFPPSSKTCPIKLKLS